MSEWGKGEARAREVRDGMKKTITGRNRTYLTLVQSEALEQVCEEVEAKNVLRVLKSFSGEG